VVPTRDHTEWALKGKQPECKANMQFHILLMLRMWASLSGGALTYFIVSITKLNIMINVAPLPGTYECGG